jgi:hypothetical protein
MAVDDAQGNEGLEVLMDIGAITTNGKGDLRGTGLTKRFEGNDDEDLARRDINVEGSDEGVSERAFELVEGGVGECGNGGLECGLAEVGYGRGGLERSEDGGPGLGKMVQGIIDGMAV